MLKFNYQEWRNIINPLGSRRRIYSYITFYSIMCFVLLQFKDFCDRSLSCNWQMLGKIHMMKYATLSYEVQNWCVSFY